MKETTGLVRAVLVVSVALGVFAPAVSVAQDCKLKLITSIDLVTHESGTAIVPAVLNGKRVGLTLQLEGIASLIESVSADRLSLPRRKAPRDLYFGKLKVKEMAQYETLTIGDLKYDKGLFLVTPTPLETPTVEGLEVVGFLSGSAFNSTDFELDLARKKLNVFSQDHCPGDVVYWADRYNSVPLTRGRAGEFFFPMDLDGKKVLSTVSTLVPSTTMATDVTRKFYGFDKSSPGVEETREANGTSYHYRSMQLTAPGLTVTNARILLIDPSNNCPLDRDRDVARYRCQGKYPLRLGADVLRQLRLYFAMREKKLYFTSADAGMSADAGATELKVLTSPPD